MNHSPYCCLFRAVRESPVPRNNRDHVDDKTGDERERRKEPPDRYRQSPIDGYSRSHDRSHDYADNKRERRNSRERALDNYEHEKMHPSKKGHVADSQSHGQHSKQNSENTQRLERGGGGSRHVRDRWSPTMQDGRHRDSQSPYIEQYKSPPAHRHLIHVEQASDTPDAADEITSLNRLDKSKQHLDPDSAAGKTSRNNRRKLESMLRNDSLSSDPSDCVRPPPPKPHKHKRGKKQRQHSLSSSDDDVRSTPECSSCEELDLESESVSEKGKKN